MYSKTTHIVQEGGSAILTKCLGTERVGTLTGPSKNLVSGKIALVLDIQVSDNSLSTVPRQPMCSSANERQLQKVLDEYLNAQISHI